MATKKIFFLAALVLLSTSGCSGYSSKYGCNGMPDGIKCKSVSEVYAGESRGVKKEPTAEAPLKESKKCGWWGGCDKEADKDAHITKDDVVRSLGQNMLGMPIRTQPTQMRVWVAPWIDADGDLHDAEFIYVEIDKGKWEIGSIQGEGDNADNNGTIINPKPPKNTVRQEQKANDTVTQQQTVTGSSKQPAFPANLNNLKPAR